MSEKQVKRERKEARKDGVTVINNIRIDILSNGDVNVTGPITDPVVCMDVIGKALFKLAMFHADRRGNDSRIVTAKPNLILPG